MIVLPEALDDRRTFTLRNDEGGEPMRTTISRMLLGAGAAIACLAVLVSCGEEPPPASVPATPIVWDVEQPASAGLQDLRSIAVVEPGVAWAAGDSGSILFYDGNAWSQQTSGTANTLRGICALDALHAWAVGDGGTILFHDGSAWTEQASGTSNTLRGVHALDPLHVWAVGDGGTILFHDGSGWAEQASGTESTLRGVSAAAETGQAWAVGDGGTILFHDGSGWAEQASGTSNTLRGACALDPLHVWAVGDRGTVLFHDGAAWAPQAGRSANHLHSVCALDPLHVWAVGDRGTILFRDGSTWTEQASQVTETLWSTCALATLDGWAALAAGDSGLILSHVESLLQGTVLNVAVHNYLTDNISLSNEQDPYCINSYTLPGVPAGNALIPGQATITVDPKGSGFKCAFTSSDMFVGIRPSGGASVGLLRLSKFPGASWKIWIENASADYSLSPSQTLKNRWTLTIKKMK